MLLSGGLPARARPTLLHALYLLLFFHSQSILKYYKKHYKNGVVLKKTEARYFIKHAYHKTGWFVDSWPWFVVFSDVGCYT